MAPTGRLRPHPEERLASPVQIVDLAATMAALCAEPHAAVDGHRQIAIVRHGPVTTILFHFTRGGVLKEYATDGVVTIHVLRGRLHVVAGDEAHDVAAGSLVALSPGVPHSVRALEPSEMLLTVNFLPPDEGDG